MPKARQVAIHYGTPLIHSSHTLLSYTPLIHSSHALLSCPPLMPSSHALLSFTPLMHSSHALLSCTPLMHSSHALSPGSNPLWDFRKVRSMLPEMGMEKEDFDRLFFPAWNIRNTRNQWIKTHSISYSWVADELLPNPDFVWPR
jgi:hypothetical protein